MTSQLVLIVEDEEDVARYVAAALQDDGYETLTASDAEEGLELARTRRPALICLDLVMPGRAGLSLYRDIRQTPELAETPIVVVSGLVPAEAAGKLGLGRTMPPPSAFVEKPIDVDRLREAVHDALDAGRTA